MPDARDLIQNRPLFSPSVVRSVAFGENNTSPLVAIDYETLASSSLGVSSSFKYDLPGSGLKSTQQLNVDWSDFAAHTFYNSAFVKTNVAFKKVFEYPFDGTQTEVETYLDGLTGYEKWVYDQFPKNKGYLFFSGTVPGQNGASGTFVTLKDIAGAQFPGLSRNLTGDSILNPSLNSMTIEFWLYLPTTINSSSIVLSKVASPSGEGNHGFGVVCNATGSTVSGSISMAVLSGTYSLTTTATIEKGVWNHFSYVWDRSQSAHKVLNYINGELYTSSSRVELGLLNMNNSDLLIGSGSTIPSFFVPDTTFSGAIDELRIWHTIRTPSQRNESFRKSIFAQDSLKLYLKFNEPSGSQSNLVADHSGNSLHGTLSSWAVSRGIREIATGSIAGQTPMTYEKLELNPVLFPAYPDLIILNEELLDSAVEFDRINPNRIDRLIPQHYLLQGQTHDALSTEQGEIVDRITATGVTADTAKLGSTQIILHLLYTWAKFFDEIKLYTQAFSDILHIDYNSDGTIPNQFLELMAKKFGIKLPPLFVGSEITQFIDAENIEGDISTNSYSLQYIQNQVWRRILINLRDILKSKGTLHSVKSFIRSVGIDPDSNFRIREFGGPTVRSLTGIREQRTETSTMLNFLSGGLITSPFLSGSRTELGLPSISGSSIGPNDGLFTSGSWTFEGIYRFPTTSSLSYVTQSLARVLVTGSASGPSGTIIGNLVAIQNQGLILYLKAGVSSSDVVISSSFNVFEGDPIYVSFGMQRGAEIGSNVSSSVFLRAAKANFGEIVSVMSQSTLVSPYTNYNPSTGVIPYFSELSATRNASGSFMQIGSDASLGASNSGFATSNASSYFGRFEGRAGHVRMWSKYLTEPEWREHVVNFKSLGVQTPTKNFNFVTTESGSWERLRIDLSTDQPITGSSVGGAILVSDFSQNNLHWSGTMFPTSSLVVAPQRFYYSLLSPKFDVAATTEKVRVRSFQNIENILSSSYAQAAPLYRIDPFERPQDNTRLTIDFSVVDALDQDIINIFGVLDSLDSVIGNPELLFASEYPSLATLRDVYFNRLTSAINLKSFVEFYKWFDTNLGTMIQQLIPRKTKFLGVNFVVESHMLERPKLEYAFSDIYLGKDAKETAGKTNITFQQFISSIGKF